MLYVYVMVDVFKATGAVTVALPTSQPCAVVPAADSCSSPESPAGGDAVRGVIGFQIMGFGTALLDGVDPNPTNFVGAGVIHTKNTQVGCLLRLEPNTQAQVHTHTHARTHTHTHSLTHQHRPR